MKAQGLKLEIGTPPEFSFDEQLSFLRLFSQDCLYQIADGIIYKAIRLNGLPILLQISAAGEDRIAVTCRYVNSDDVSVDGVIEYVKEWFDLDTDLRPFYAMARADEVLAPVVKKYRGLHIVAIPSLFEALTWAIIGQQINLTFAYTLKRRFVQAFGKCVEENGRDYWLFPTPQEVAGLRIEDFLALQFSRRKAEYLLGTARAIADGQLTKEKLLASPTPEDAKQMLVSIKGIGPWTADYVLLKCMREPTAFPVGDVALQNAIKARLHLSRKPTMEEMRQVALPWEGWEAYATFYLWRTLFVDK